MVENWYFVTVLIKTTPGDSYSTLILSSGNKYLSILGTVKVPGKYEENPNY